MLIGLGLCGTGVAASEHAPALHLQNVLSMLVLHFPLGADQTDIGFRAHGPGLQNFVLQVQDVIGEDGFFPLHVFQAW
jgi:hypothetical protein